MRCFVVTGSKTGGVASRATSGPKWRFHVFKAPVLKGVEMKRIVLLTVAVLCVSSLAVAQYNPGSIDVYSDIGQGSCNFLDAGGLVLVFVYHTNSDGATASNFMLELGAGVTWSFLGPQWQFATVIGNPMTGVDIGYGACLGAAGDIYLGQLSFFGSSAAACSMISIVIGNGVSGFLEIIDCSAVKFLLDRGGQGRINPDGTCDCSVPVQETTWGGIKALYN